MISTIGKHAIDGMIRIGYTIRFFFKLLSTLPSLLGRRRFFLEQFYFIGNLSLLLVVVSGLFVGFILGLQGYYTLSRYGSEQALGLLVALSLVRELGPVVSALLFAGRAGSSITAEIGLMKAGEQLNAMDMMSVDPVNVVLGPRFYSGVLALPLLSVIFSAIGIFGSYIVGVLSIGIDKGAFWSQMQIGINFTDDILTGIIKSFIFAFAVTAIAVYQGFESRPTPVGVSKAATRTVVFSTLAVFILDFLLTAVMFVN